MKRLLLLCLFVSNYALGEETYACFKQGIDNPKPRKLVISTDGVEWFVNYKQRWQVNTEQDFCNASNQYFNLAEGFVELNCFNREEATLYTTHTQFGIFADNESSLTWSATWRCIAAG